ncbi:MAG: hypothetical protein IJP57_07690 [Firmicutes bacterium]|nr:hypothetical protein [Bacillota bacterium]
MDLNFVEFMPFAAILADEAMALKKEENVLIVTDSRVGRYPGSEPFLQAIPAGNLAAGATFGSANGRIVFDERFNLFKDRFLRDPIQLTVENSRITKIEGGIEAEAFKNAVDSLPYPKEKILNLAEFGLGFNKGADFFGIDAGEWEKVYGAAHFGIGSNAPFGGAVDIPFHEDGMVAGAFVEIDGETVTENGEFCI